MASVTDSLRIPKCPHCQDSHIIDNYFVGEGKSKNVKNDMFDNGYMFSETYYEWTCPVTNKLAVSRMYWGDAFPL